MVLMAGGFRLVVNADADDITQDAIRDYFVYKLGPRILANARRAVPVDTGDLKRSIIVQVSNDGDEVVMQVGVDDTIADVDYGLYVEQGTSRTRAQPYLRPAVYQARGRIV